MGGGWSTQHFGPLVEKCIVVNVDLTDGRQ